jgi:DHA1 family inner membrane transport protein
VNTHEEKPGRRGNVALLLILGAGGFTSALNVTMLSPLLVDIAELFDVSEAAAGQLATVTAASAGVMAITVTPWMDRYSRRFWFRFECVLLLIGTLITALSPAFGLMFIGRIVAGAGGAVIGANCLAACNDLFPDKTERNRAIGLISSAFTLGAVVGLPLITLIASWLGWRAAVGTPALLALLILYGSGRLPGGRPVHDGSLWAAWKGGYARVFASRETLLILSAVTGFITVWFGWFIFFGAFVEKTHAVTAGMLSALFLIGGAGELFGNNLAPWAMRRINARTVSTVGLALAAVNLLLTGIVWTGGWTLFPYIAIGSGALAVIFIPLNVILLDSLPRDPGAAMSLQSACFELGGAAGVALAGIVLTLLDDDYERTYQILALILPLLALLIWRSARHHQPAPEAVPEPTPA